MTRGFLLLRLNRWPILLDLFAVSLGIGCVACWSTFHSLLVSLLLALASLVVVISSLRLHFLTGHRLRAWTQLVARNRRGFKPDSFQVFMGAPCGRDVVQAVLREVGHFDQYRILRQKYYSGFWGRYDSSPVRIIPYQNPQRGPRG